MQSIGFQSLGLKQHITHCKLKMFWQQVLQLGNAFIYSVPSFLFDQSVWQLVSLLDKVKMLSVIFKTRKSN